MCFPNLLLRKRGREPHASRFASRAGWFRIGRHQRSRHGKGSEQQGGGKPLQVFFHGKVPFQGELHRDNVLSRACAHKAR